MMLASMTEIRNDLGFDDMPDINEAITSALHGTTHALASVLRTPFDRIAHTDLFFVERSDEGANNRCDLRLSAGFVQPSSFVAKVSTRADMADVLVVTSNFLVRDGKGIATDFTRRYRAEYVQVTYTAGFEPDAGNPESYNLAQVPSWLQEAAKLHAKIMLDEHPSLREAGVNQNVFQMTRTLETMIEQHSRYAPWALLPQ